MSFRKRNIGVQRSPVASSSADVSVETNTAPAPTASGIRPSPLTGQPTTSTGAYSLDSLLGGHAGLALGSSLLVEESGTTDFAGALLRYYAAEGIIQSHTVHLVGAGEQWIKDLPGLVGDAEAAEAQKQAKSDEKKMKIAWRYERLGQVDADRGSRVVPQRGPTPVQTFDQQDEQQSLAFCHTFDLAKRLVVPAEADINHIAISPQSPLLAILQNVAQRLSNSKPHTIHRLV
ncbi:paxneb protein, partial [Aureobasidium melanogenum]